MNVTELALSGVKLVETRRFGDARGFFSETYNAADFAAAGINDVFVQDNHSRSSRPGTIRGLHFQRPPFAQAKLVRVVRGQILDIAVDIRHGSPTFGQWISEELSAENWRQLYIPIGFAHGFCTLGDDTEVIYKVTAPYSPEHDGGIRWDDPDIRIPWPFEAAAVTLSVKDSVLPRFRDIEPVFYFPPD